MTHHDNCQESGSWGPAEARRFLSQLRELGFVRMVGAIPVLGLVAVLANTVSSFIDDFWRAMQLTYVWLCRDSGWIIAQKNLDQ